MMGVERKKNGVREDRMSNVNGRETFGMGPGPIVSRKEKEWIAVYGIESYLGALLSDIETAQYAIHFVANNSSESLSDYDSVIVLQGANESLEKQRTVFGISQYIVSDRDQLDKRTKELLKLVNKRGFVLFVLTRPFYDYFEGKVYTETDLVKRFSKFNDLSRNDLSKPDPYVFPVRSELKDFCERYGRAYSVFNYNAYSDEGIDYIPLIATSGDKEVGISILKNVYFLQTILPQDNQWEDFFCCILDGIRAIHNKRRLDLPRWVSQITIGDEESLSLEKERLEKRIFEIDERKQLLTQHKRVLLDTSEDLVSDVAALLSEVTDYTIDFTDNKKEDCRLRDKEGRVVALVEVKGINGNIKMSHVSQAFEHRERTEGYANLPVILIANTFIGTACSESAKDKPPEEEQILLAERHNVLLVRTLDLLRIYDSVVKGKISKSDVGNVFMSRIGWLNWRELE